MKNNTSKKSKFLLNTALVALLAITTASASIMMGCGSKTTEVSATPDSPVTETKVVSETQVLTEVVDVTGEGSDENGDSKSSSGSSSSVSNSSNGSNSNSNNNSNNSGSNTNNNSSSNAGNNTNNNSGNNAGNNSDNNNNNSNNGNNSGNNSNNNGNNSNNGGNNSGNSSKVLKINGKSFNVGDTVTCKLNIKTPDYIENFQGQIVYDSKYLECTKAKLIGEARGGSVINFRTTPGIIKFNGSSGVDGYNFMDGATMIEVTYTVKAAGSTTPTDKWEIVRRLTENGSGINYIKDGKPSNGMTSSLSYSN